MIDITMRSSMRVKPDSRFEVRGSRCRSVRGVVFMSSRYLNRMTAIEYRRFAWADGVDEGGEPGYTRARLGKARG
jgi:hypothetical protein